MAKHRHIVCIGGGSIFRGETKTIDLHIINLTGKKHPKALFIPTASNDMERYVDSFMQVYGDRYGCKVDALRLISAKPSKKEIRSKIEWADLIYVGGGNTLRMMNTWRRLGVDALLRKAYKNGTVCSGLSAGAICWCAYGHSDSMYFYNPKKWDYIRAKALGILPITLCPHMDDETGRKKRRKEFMKMIEKLGGHGVGIDNCAAMHFRDDTYKVLSAKKEKGAYTVRRIRGKAHEKAISKKKQYKPIAEILR